MKFAKEMKAAKETLGKMGHEVQVPYGTEDHVKDGKFVDDLDRNKAYCLEEDVMRKCFEQVAESDAVLVLNNRRNNIDGYIGVSALMELGIAYFLRKKLYILNAIPSHEEHRWAHEVSIIQPTILHGKLENLT